MAKRKKGPTPRRRLPIPGSKPRVTYTLESGTLEGIVRDMAYYDAYRKFWWQFYAELAYQRAQIADKLHSALSRNVRKDFHLDQWQRATRWKYALHPLSTAGSVKYGGGRFNVGEIDQSRFSVFPALYLAQDKGTALQEALGQGSGPSHGLTPEEIALTNPQSEVIVSVSGVLEEVIDLTNADSLQEFVNLVGTLKVSASLLREATKVNLDPNIVRSIQNVGELLTTFLEPNWRQFPQIADIPANSQIFGELVRSAKIGGILYPSKLSGKQCLTIYPSNFKDTSSLLHLDDEAPTSSVVSHIDRSNWQVCERVE
jgi:RES domain-containing protein